jgi:hypothetical protein
MTSVMSDPNAASMLRDSIKKPGEASYLIRIEPLAFAGESGERYTPINHRLVRPHAAGFHLGSAEAK